MWSNLKVGRCPSQYCDGFLKANILTGTRTCTECEFKIGSEKHDQILRDMFAKKAPKATIYKQEIDNMEALNNLSV